MIKLAKKNKLRFKDTRFVFFSILVFLFSYIIRINLIIPLFLISLYLYINLRRPNFKTFDLLNVILLFLIYYVSSYFIINVRLGWAIFYIPFSVIPMLSTMLFGDLEISLLITLISSISISSITGNNYYLGVLILVSGILSSLLVQHVRRRNDVIRAGLIIGLVQAITQFFIEQFRVTVGFEYIILIGNGIISSIVVLGILPIFEYLFNTITNISLLELLDHPLLRQMKLDALGTYHHSLIVGNLSETTCEVVGANALLSRVGAYYHDIGKLSKPEYFSENQKLEASIHDSLSPSMSKLIIMNHVKEGVELAKKYKLNPRLVDFIQQHHGTGLVYYFYRRALENLEEDQEIEEEVFRYPGPKPNTKETAIVLLADSVEAATRALKDPTPTKIEEAVHKIINNKFIEGQLDECDLTLRDLEKISSLFIKILSGMYHSRVTYPEEK